MMLEADLLVWMILEADRLGPNVNASGKVRSPETKRLAHQLTQ